MRREAWLSLSLGEIEYIQSLLARHNKPRDWFLIRSIDEQTGGKYGKNWIWY